MLRLAAVAKAWGTRPSSLLRDLGDDDYTAFCLDEAAAYVLGREQERLLEEERAKAGLPGRAVGSAPRPSLIGPNSPFRVKRR